MKIALCFIISYQHVLNKEALWREWIEPNSDIIHVYFYYKDIRKIASPWIRAHAIPPQHIYPTSYYHVVPAYLSVLQYAHQHDPANQWFCLLTDSCCPIISPQKFRQLFLQHSHQSILKWRPAWWNVHFHKRANLAQLPRELHLANDPWFVLSREKIDVLKNLTPAQQEVAKTICRGGLANESFFAVLFHCCGQLLGSSSTVISEVTHLADWSRMSSATSPHLFVGDAQDVRFIETQVAQYPYAMFLRKVSPAFPDELLKKYISIDSGYCDPAPVPLHS